MEDAPSFFKFIVSPYRDLRKLSIPTEFTKENGLGFLDHAYLRAPGGLEYKVDMKKHGDDVWFSNGWKEFAENYSISFGYFLVFYYQGNSRFNVLIYDKSSCEIDYHSFDTQSSDEDEDEVEDSEDIQIMELEKGKVAMHEAYMTTEDEDEEQDCEEQSMDDVKLEKGKVDMSEAYLKAEDFHCANPSFIVAMSISYVKTDGRMWVPLRHGLRYLKEANEAVLQVESGPETKVKIASGEAYLRFGSGWSDFVVAYQLKVNDVCKFELIDQRTHTYRVHIFRRDH